MDILIVPVLRICLTLLAIYSNIILIAIILSWLRSFNVINTSNRFVFLLCDALDRLTEPVFQRARVIIPPLGGLDFSPVIVLISIEFIQMVLVRILMRF